MCSNSSNSGGGSRGGDGGGWTMASKKPPKRRKVPKRGPGVAELEKILREREKKDSNTADPYHSQPRPPLHIPPPPPMTVIYANGSSNTILGRGNGGVGGGGGGRGGVCVVGGSGVSLPEQDLFAITLDSCKSNMDRVDGSNSNPGIPLGTPFSNESSDPQCPSSNLLRRKHFQYPAMMVNHNLPGFATPSLLTTPSSAGKYHHVEPPSYQRSCLNYTSNWPEEEKVLDIMRRPKPFSVGYSPGPQFHVQSSSCDNRSAFYFDPTNTISRDTRGGGPLDMINSKKCITACGAAAQNNFYTLSSPTIPSPTTQSLQGEFSKFDLLQVGRKELGLSLNSERGEAEADNGIDLNLKL